MTMMMSLVTLTKNVIGHWMKQEGKLLLLLLLLHHSVSFLALHIFKKRSNLFHFWSLILLLFELSVKFVCLHQLITGEGVLCIHPCVRDHILKICERDILETACGKFTKFTTPVLLGTKMK